jgi:hypothetical protein
MPQCSSVIGDDVYDTNTSAGGRDDQSCLSRPGPDRECSGVYLRLLDAEEAGADWREVVTVVFGLDPVAEPERSHTIYASHLERARWMSRQGYRDLVWPKA